MRAVTVSEYGGIPVVGEIPTPGTGSGAGPAPDAGRGHEPDGWHARLGRLAAGDGERSLPMAEIRRTPPARVPGSCPQARPRPSGREKSCTWPVRAPCSGNGTDQLAVRARTTITPSCSATPSMTRDDNRENTIPVRSSMSHPAGC